MFSVGDYMVYGINGVCLVEDICASPFDKKDTRSFYMLKPLGAPAGSVIYTPTDNAQIAMRPLMTKAQAEQLIGQLAEIGILEVPSEKMRRDIYRQTMQSCDPVKYVSLIKTVRRRRADMIAAHKRLSETDSDFERNAKISLYHELSVALEKPYAEIEPYVLEKLETA